MPYRTEKLRANATTGSALLYLPTAEVRGRASVPVTANSSVWATKEPSNVKGSKVKEVATRCRRSDRGIAAPSRTVSDECCNHRQHLRERGSLEARSLSECPVSAGHAEFEAASARMLPAVG